MLGWSPTGGRWWGGVRWHWEERGEADDNAEAGLHVGEGVCAAGAETVLTSTEILPGKR